MDSKTKLEEKLQYLREQWLVSTPEERVKIEKVARQIKNRIANGSRSDEKIKSAQARLSQWAEEFRNKQRQLPLRRNGATPEEIFK